MTYAVDADLVKVRPNILSLGVADWEVQREEAYSIINRIIIRRWYREAAKIMGYDPNLTSFEPEQVANDCLKRLEVYKTLELAYLYLLKGGGEEDGFERQMEIFRRRYNDELNLLFDSGIDYDWSGDDTLDDDEKFIRAPRRLMRA
jgi:hypothetical protein